MARKYKRIDIQATYLDSNLTGFPLYVPISADANIGAVCKADGTDVYFYDSDGVTLLPYERVSFAVADGKATGEFWVKCNPSTSGKFIFCSYGDSSASDLAAATSVWDSYFQGVWHMNDYDTSHVHDSTANANHGTKKGANEPIEVTGKINKAQDFDGANDYADLGAGTAFRVATKTISWWARPHGSIASLTPIFSGVATNYYVGFNATNRLYASWANAAGTQKTQYLSATNAVVANEWHLYSVKFVVDGSNVTVTGYIDGVAQTSYIFTGTDGYYGTYAGAKFYIGAFSSGSFFFDGDVDDLRVSTTARSDAWQKFTYRNMAESDNELTWGSQQAAGVGHGEYGICVDIKI